MGTWGNDFKPTKKIDKMERLDRMELIGMVSSLKELRVRFIIASGKMEQTTPSLIQNLNFNLTGSKPLFQRHILRNDYATIGKLQDLGPQILLEGILGLFTVQQNEATPGSTISTHQGVLGLHSSFVSGETNRLLRSFFMDPFELSTANDARSFSRQTSAICETLDSPRKALWIGGPTNNGRWTERDDCSFRLQCGWCTKMLYRRSTEERVTTDCTRSQCRVALEEWVVLNPRLRSQIHKRKKEPARPDEATAGRITNRISNVSRQVKTYFSRNTKTNSDAETHMRYYMYWQIPVLLYSTQFDEPHRRFSLLHFEGVILHCELQTVFSELLRSLCPHVGELILRDVAFAKSTEGWDQLSIEEVDTSSDYSIGTCTEWEEVFRLASPHPRARKCKLSCLYGFTGPDPGVWEDCDEGRLRVWERWMVEGNSGEYGEGPNSDY